MKEKGKRKKILILSRKYPPSIGGMQAYTKNFIRRMEDIYTVDKIVLGKEQVHLVWFLPYLFVKSTISLARRGYDMVYLCDGLLAPLGAALKKMFGVRAVVTVHGLDVTYDGFFYQRVVPPAIAKLDRVVCVSANTMAECVGRGVPEEKCAVITNGIEPGEYVTEYPCQDPAGKLARETGMDIGGKKILITVGRLIRRKGMDWFVGNVMPRLEDDYIYLIAGDGPERGGILEAVDRHGMKGRVGLLGRVSPETLALLYNSAYAMVLPNRKIKEDPEGFGIVAIEAAGCGLPVIANAVDGISEAVLEGKTGRLIEEDNIDRFVEAIKDPGINRGEIKEAGSVFHWGNKIEEYRRLIDAF